MLKKVLTVPGIVAILAVVFLLGSVSLGVALAQSPDEGQAGAKVEEQVGDQTELDDDAAEAEAEGVDLDDVEEEVGDQSELDDDTDEAATEDPAGGLESQVEQDGEFDGEF